MFLLTTPFAFLNRLDVPFLGARFDMEIKTCFRVSFSNYEKCQEFTFIEQQRCAEAGFKD